MTVRQKKHKNSIGSWKKWHEQCTKVHPPADKSQFPRWQFEGNKNEGWLDYPQDVQAGIRERWDPTVNDLTEAVSLVHETGLDGTYMINVFPGPTRTRRCRNCVRGLE